MSELNKTIQESEETKKNPTFEDLGLSEETIESILQNGIQKPTAVQTQTIPQILSGESLVFQSETGTGKTLAFLLPIKEKQKKAIILAPTTELCSQIKTQAKSIGLSAVLCVGNSPIKRQVDALKEKPNVVVGSPARILELTLIKKIKTDNFQTLVLDEIDRLLSPELKENTISLIQQFSKNDVQILACSATLTKKSILNLFDSSQKKIQTVFLPPEDVLQKRISHLAIFSQRRDKIETLRKLLVAEKPQKTLIFTSRADQVANITSKLKYKNVECDCLFAKADKVKRKSVIDKFRSGKLKILITSDLCARGLDIFGITHIIQMDLPEEIDFFVHRAGRTARAGQTGKNIVIGDEREILRLSSFEKKLKIVINPRELKNGKLIKPILDERK